MGVGCGEDVGSPAMTWVPAPPHWSPDLAGPEGQAGGGQGWRALVCWDPRR